MRNAFGIFGLVCGVIVVALVSRYGFKTTDVEADAWIMSFLFGVIAAFGLAGHAFAVRLWRYSRIASICAGVVAFAALGLNLSNSLGAIAGRSDVAQTERVEKNRKIRAADAELKRITGLRDAMAAFVPTDDAAVDAARRAADAATRARKAECGDGDPKQRGKNCRNYETTENEANENLSSATANKAATDRASKLEADADAQRALLNGLGTLVTVNVQGTAIAKLFRLQDDEAGFAATVQQFGVAAVVELIILICLIGWEVLGRDMATPSTRFWNVSTKREIDDTQPDTVVIPKPAKPTLVSATSVPVGSVNRILTDSLDSSQGSRVELAEIAKRYRDVCKARDRKPVSQAEFIEGVDKFCKAIGIRRRTIDGHLYLMDVQLSENKTVMAVDKDA